LPPTRYHEPGRNGPVGRVGLVNPRAPQARLHVGDHVALELDGHLVVLGLPAVDRGEPAERAVAVGHDNATAVDQRPPVGRRERLVLFVVRAADAHHLVVGRLAGNDAGDLVSTDDHATLTPRLPG